MQKSITLQPQGFIQALSFFLRRPDAKWRAPLLVTPSQGRVLHAAGSKFYKIEEQVCGMKTVLWIPQDQLDAGLFTKESAASLDWWEGEWKEVVKDYLRRLWPNSPSVFLALVALFFAMGLLVQSRRAPEQVLQYIMTSDAGAMALWMIGVLVICPLVSLWICRQFPARTRLANLLFQLEAWLILLSVLTSANDFKPEIESFRAQAQVILSSFPQ